MKMQISGMNDTIESVLPNKGYSMQNEKVGSAQESVETKGVAEKKLEEKLNENDFLEKKDKTSKDYFYDENELQFSIHEGTNRIMIKVINRESHKVVKEIPEEKILDMIAQMCQNSGICIDERK